MMKELLSNLCAAFGVSGGEDRVRSLIEGECRGYCDEITTDAMGNLIVRKKGAGKRLMLAAHMDEIGFMITTIDDKGFLRFAPVGGVEVKDVLHRAVMFEGGLRGVISFEKKVKTADLTLSHCYIDIGVKTKEEAAALVKTGDLARFDGSLQETGGLFFGPALDNRAGCCVLIETIKSLNKSGFDLWFVFTSQEEVGLRGAKTAAYSIEPDMALAVDVTDTGDTPNCPDMAVSLGDGPCIKVKDGGILAHREVRDLIEKGARRVGVPYQLEVLTSGSTDAGAIHTSRGGVKSGGISIPARYLHSAVEAVSKSDLENAVRLLCATLEESGAL